MAQNFERPVAGFNHNIKHGGKVFHVQTEDSGVKNAHIITHLFVGGNVVASKKISYAEIAQAENLADRVRQLMEGQHKEILRNLINGVYDEPGSNTAGHYQPGKLVPGAPASPPAIAAQPVAKRGAVRVPPKAVERTSDTLFGEDLISEKSLDEVILGYLAGDSES
ncbi:MAG TPA: hypothetical protein VF947_01450 [Myxococcales bacterium]